MSTLREFLTAVRTGDLKTVEKLVGAVDVNQKHDDGMTALILAARWNQVEVLKCLIKNKANLEDKDLNGKTALILAARWNQVEVLKCLIENKANLEDKDHLGYTALTTAALYGQLDVVKLLTENGANLEAKVNGGWTALITAAGNGKLDVVKLLVESDANLEAKNDDGLTALIEAARYSQLDVLKYLIENKANLEAKENLGFTALLVSSQNGHSDVVSCLIENGANLEAKSNDGATALHMAANNGHLEVVQYLHSKGAELGMRRLDGSTPVKDASLVGHLNVVKWLILKGCDVNEGNEQNYTPLMSASQNGHLDTVIYLLEQGAKLEEKNFQGRTAEMLASIYGFTDIAMLLKEKSKQKETSSVKVEVFDLQSQTINEPVPSTNVSDQTTNDKETDKIKEKDCPLGKQKGFKKLWHTIKQKAFTSKQAKRSSDVRPKTTEFPPKETKQHLTELGLAQKIPDDTTEDAGGSDSHLQERNLSTQMKEGRSDLAQQTTEEVKALSTQMKDRHSALAQHSTLQVSESTKEDPMMQTEDTSTSEDHHILIDDDTKKVWSDWEKQALVETSTARILTCGKYCNGKTSLSRSLVYNKPYTCRIEDRTRVMNYQTWRISSNTSVPVFDLGGHQCYQQLAHIFHSNSHNNISLLVHELTSTDYLNTCQWMTDITSKSPKSHLLIALTKSDMVSVEDKPKWKDQFKKNVLCQIDKQIESLQFNKDILDDHNTKQHVTTVLRKYNNIKQAIKDESILYTVSCTTPGGFFTIRERILEIVNSPECRIAIPVKAHKIYIQLGRLGIESLKVSEQLNKNNKIESTKEQVITATSSAENVMKIKVTEDILATEMNEKLSDTFSKEFKSHLTNDQNVTEHVDISDEESTTNFITSDEESTSKLITSDEESTSKLITSEEESTSKLITSDEESTSKLAQDSLQCVTFMDAKKDFKAMMTESVSDEELTALLKEYLGLLHVHGLILWYNTSPDLEDYIFNDLHSFVNFLKGLFQHDIDDALSFDALTTEIKVQLFKEGIEEIKYNRFIQKLLEEGLMSVYLLHVFTMKHGFHSEIEILIGILQLLNVAFLIPLQKQGTDTSIKQRWLYFPWYVRSMTIPHNIKHLVSDLEKPNTAFLNLHVVLKGFLPTSFFQSFVILLYKVINAGSHNGSRYTWGCGMYAMIHNIQLLVKHSRDLTTKDTLDIYIRSFLEQHSVHQSWDLLRCCLIEINNLTSSWWPGIVTNKYLICPHCEIACDGKVDEQRERFSWIIRDHSVKPCEVGQVCQCRWVRDASFPASMVYPLPLDVSADSCVLEMRNYMEDPIKWSEEVRPTGMAVKRDVVSLEMTEICEDSLKKLAKIIGGNWLYLGNCLGLKLSELQVIRDSYPNNQEEAAFYMLMWWRSKHGGIKELQNGVECTELNINIVDCSDQKRALSTQIKDDRDTLVHQGHLISTQIRDVKTELSQQLILQSSDASGLLVQCQHPVLFKHQKLLEEYMDPNKELLDCLISHDLISFENKKIIFTDKTPLGKVKRILFILECCDSHKVREFIEALNDCCIGGDNSALADRLRDDYNEYLKHQE